MTNARDERERDSGACGVEEERVECIRLGALRCEAVRGGGTAGGRGYGVEEYNDSSDSMKTQASRKCSLKMIVVRVLFVVIDWACLAVCWCMGDFEEARENRRRCEHENKKLDWR